MTYIYIYYIYIMEFSNAPEDWVVYTVHETLSSDLEFRSVYVIYIYIYIYQWKTFTCLFLSVSDIVNIVCYSLILLSVDHTSPHVKNKMSKREFIRNICSAVQFQRNNHVHNDNMATVVDRDFAGHLYDNVYLVGHIAPQRWWNGL